MSLTLDELSFDNRLDLSGLQATTERIRAELHKIIIGQDQMIDLLLAAMLSNGHVLIEGVPGVAKTLTARLMARCVSVDFTRIQFTPDLMPSDVLGTSVFNLKTNEFEFRRGPIFSNLVLIDEINRAPAKTQSALFEVMEERQVSIDGVTHPLRPPFLVFGTQNPVEHEGTYRLPEAQLDRFLFHVEVQYPTIQEEIQLLVSYHSKHNHFEPTDVQPVLTADELLGYQALTRRLHIEPHLITYIAQLVYATRENASVYLGASPRASMSLLTASKALAAMRGRDFVTPEDIQFVARPVLRHRIILTPEVEMQGLTATDIIDQMIQKIEIPR